MRLRTFLIATLTWTTFSGCAAPRVALRELKEPGSLQIVLDANHEIVQPGTRMKFYVDIQNTGKNGVDLAELDIELLAAPAGRPKLVALRKEWGYRQRAIVVEPGKSVTYPIVPEVNTFQLPNKMRQDLRVSSANDMVSVSEFPLEKLAPGTYEIRALVGGRWISRPFRLRVQQPSVTAPKRAWPKDVPIPRGLLRTRS